MAKAFPPWCSQSPRDGALTAAGEVVEADEDGVGVQGAGPGVAAVVVQGLRHLVAGHPGGLDGGHRRGRQRLGLAGEPLTGHHVVHADENDEERENE
jgi:hypothetical protein